MKDGTNLTAHCLKEKMGNDRIFKDSDIALEQRLKNLVNEKNKVRFISSIGLIL